MLHHFVRISCLLSNALHLICYELRWKEIREKGSGSLINTKRRHSSQFPISCHLYPPNTYDLHRQTGLWLGTEDPAQTRTQRRPCHPAPSSGSHPQRLFSAPKMPPGEKTTSFKGLSMTLSICVWNVILGLQYFMEAYDGFRVDANYMQTPSIALKEMGE